MEDEILIKFMLGETTPTETAQVEKWISQNEDNLKYYRQFETIWNSSKRLEKKINIDVDKAWFTFKHNSNVIKDQVRIKKIRYQYLLGAAAAIVVICALSLFFNPFKPEEFETFTSRSEIVTKRMEDGSQITLNKNTRITYARNFESNRNVKIESGDVFFNVVPDKKHPFVIKADFTSITVVGTSFNVSRNKDLITVNVESGIVKVNHRDHEINLQKGEKVIVSNSNPALRKEKDNDKIYNYYQTRVISSRNTTLAELVKVLSKAYDRDVSVANTSVGRMRITTELPIDSTLDKNLETICKTMDLSAERNFEQITLSNRK